MECYTLKKYSQTKIRYTKKRPEKIIHVFNCNTSPAIKSQSINPYLPYTTLVNVMQFISYVMNEKIKKNFATKKSYIK